MRHHAIARHSMPLAVLAFLLVLAGCSGKQLSSSVQDQTLVPPPEVAEPAPEPEPAPIEEAFVPPEPEPIPEPMMEEPVPEPLEEAFVPEPEMMPEPMPEMEPGPFMEPEPFVEEPTPEPFEEAFVAPEPEPFMPEPEPFVPEPEPMPEPEPELAPLMEEAQVPEPEPEVAFEPTPMEEMPMEPEPPVIEEVTPEPLPPPEPLVLDDVYFDFDRFSIRGDAQMALEANARRLRDDENWTLTIEGHCDERGTIAYNLVLGERRAEAVKKYLQDLGVPGWKINIVSYGKEKPFCQDHNEECWQENRRAHFVY